MPTLTDTLTEQVDSLVQPSQRPLVWGHPRMSTTPTSVAIRELAERTEALEETVRLIALEVQRLAEHQD